MSSSRLVERDRLGRSSVTQVLCQRQKRPMTVSKETYYSVKRDLLQGLHDIISRETDLEGASEVAAAFRHMAALFPPHPGDAFESAPLPPLSLPPFAHLAFPVHLACAVSLSTLFQGL